MQILSAPTFIATSLVGEIKVEVDVGQEEICDAVWKFMSSDIERILERCDFELEDDGAFSMTFYATKRADSLFVEFCGEYQCADRTGEARPDAALRVEGDGSFIHTSREFIDLKPLRLEMEYVNALGERETTKNAYARMQGIVIGHRIVSHTVKHRLD